MKAKTVLFVLLGLAAVNVQADGGYGYEAAYREGMSAPYVYLARMSRGERRDMRGGREAPPEEGAAMRRQFRQRWLALPPEERERRRQELREYWNDRAPQPPGRGYRQYQEDDSGYGRGYEHRGYRR
jgi:hypothetical protein